ncbi:MAG: P1 family peptidase, partial [bacterium]|nr:P1 family peptidase [bacterium]
MLGSDSGVLVGHWTDKVARTGCTVVVLPEGAVTSGEVRGGAPASRDFGLLEPQRTVTAVDAVVLTGGSAFGLAAVDGVMTWCEEQGRGFQTRAGRVPIVVGLALYDLAEGDSTVRPQPKAGYAAAQTARAQIPQLGRVGAGAGATMNKWRGPEHRKPGGLGGAVVQVGDVKVGALVAVNAAGDLNDGSVVAELVAGTYEHQVVDPFVASADGIGCSTGNGAGDSAGSSTAVATAEATSPNG